MTKGPGDRRRGQPDLAINRDQRGPEGPATDEGDRRDLAINRDQRGPEGPATDEGDRRISLLIGTRGDQRDRRWLR